MVFQWAPHTGPNNFGYTSYVPNITLVLSIILNFNCFFHQFWDCLISTTIDLGIFHLL